MKLKVCIAGASGWVGKPLCLAVSATDDMTLVGAVSRTHEGRGLKEVVEGLSVDLKVSGSVAEALDAPTDVMVDYTKADAVKANVLEAITRGVHVVIGSSGLTDEDFVEIDRAASERGVGVIAAGNFAITAVLLQRFACEAAKYLSQWEIIDYASDSKPDAPSGTARELAFRLSEVRRPEPTRTVEQTAGERESRGATLNGMQVHSVRLPGYVIGVEAVFGAKDERLSIRHDAGAGAGPYIQGTLLAIRKAGERVGLVRGLDKILGD
ncbi:MAG TPA: 4-hydroxy-tetrahydrodipicolinate reductase [Pyrinomonadaceae bacterium]|jgi:4-hydroxy-tetrahydrodipicolinate reductase|nr:4-hydroxy-tetrahydrodipicolinate reductase [Pyrinomonadaceae bacterium]